MYTHTSRQVVVTNAHKHTSTHTERREYVYLAWPTRAPWPDEGGEGKGLVGDVVFLCKF